MKRYTVEVVIEEGNDEFWEDINKRKVTGCDEVLSMMNEMKYDNPDITSIKMIKYEDNDE